MKTETNVAPRVRCFEPTARFDTMTRIANVFVRPLLRSSTGKGIHELALLSFVGRRSGKRYEVPVQYHELDGEPLILTAAPWRANLRGGADVELIHEARRVSMRAELIEDADEVASLYEALIQQIGVAKAKATKIGIEVDGEQRPTHQEIRNAVAGRRTVIRLRPR
jgi:hypothetical protein